MFTPSSQPFHLRHRRFCFGLLAIAATLYFGVAPTARASGKPKEITIGDDEIDKALEGKKTYDFAIVSADEIVDFQGRHFAPKAVKAYLKKAKPEKNAAYILWTSDEDSLKTAKILISGFSDYGVTVCVVRKMKGDKTTTAKPAEEKTADRPRSVMLVGKPNSKSLTANDRLPDMSTRPPNLVPGKLPPRVRYQFHSDAEVVAAAEIVTRAFLDAAPAEKGPAAEPPDHLLLQPGAWMHLIHLPVFQSTRTIISQVELGQNVAHLEGAILEKPEECRAALDEFRSRIQADGGGTVRALQTKEMDRWWTFVGFDIQEPVFAIETKGGHYCFIVDCHKSKVSLIDELNALPGK